MTICFSNVISILCSCHISTIFQHCICLEHFNNRKSCISLLLWSTFYTKSVPIRRNENCNYSSHGISSKENFQLHKLLPSALQVPSTKRYHMKDEDKLYRPSPSPLMSHKPKTTFWCIVFLKKCF